MEKNKNNDNFSDSNKDTEQILSKKDYKEYEKLQKKCEKLEDDYKELFSKYNELLRESMLYKASHDAIMDTKKAQDILKKKEQELLAEKKYATKSFITDILEPFELFEQTLSMKNIPDPVKNWLKGFEMILNKFKNVLNQHGVKEINPNVNSDLNEHLHEVIEEINDEKIQSGKIAQVVRKGYLLHDRVIKYAQVKTNKNKTSK